jgi:hypothetical protein
MLFRVCARRSTTTRSFFASASLPPCSPVWLSTIDERQFAEEGVVVIQLLQQLLRLPHRGVRSYGLRIDCVAFHSGFHDFSYFVIGPRLFHCTVRCEQASLRARCTPFPALGGFYLQQFTQLVGLVLRLLQRGVSNRNRILLGNSILFMAAGHQ